MKSIVLLSLTALRLRLVLNWRPASVGSEGDRRGPRERTAGLSDVRREEKVAGPVMERGRVVGLVRVLRVRCARARVEMRQVDMIVEKGLGREDGGW
jgi:hypothetical protein